MHPGTSRSCQLSSIPMHRQSNPFPTWNLLSPPMLEPQYPVQAALLLGRGSTLLAGNLVFLSANRNKYLLKEKKRQSKPYVPEGFCQDRYKASTVPRRAGCVPALNPWRGGSLQAIEPLLQPHSSSPQHPHWWVLGEDGAWWCFWKPFTRPEEAKVFLQWSCMGCSWCPASFVSMGFCSWARNPVGKAGCRKLEVPNTQNSTEGNQSL